MRALATPEDFHELQQLAATIRELILNALQTANYECCFDNILLPTTLAGYPGWKNMAAMA